ncbi:carbohydrate binding-domain-containing protein [Mycena latifolia]|nr:carbohydrate binding-domain-containing protein [Mycena latifolia]
MAPLLSIVLTAFVASLVAAENLASCGSSNYYPSQYTCFDNSFLCPIIKGDRNIRCGDACYSTSLYSCSNNTLEPINKNGPETLEACGGSMFYPSQAIRVPRREFPLSFHVRGRDLEYTCAAYHLPPSNYTTDERPAAPTANCLPFNFGRYQVSGSV